MIENKEDQLYGFELEFGYEKLSNGLIKFNNQKTHKLKYLAKGPSFEIVSNALIESTYINHITGKPFVLTSVLYKIIFESTIIEVRFEENEDLVSFVTKNIDVKKENYNLIKLISKHWLKAVI